MQPTKNHEKTIKERDHHLDTAAGEQLDAIGRLYGYHREQEETDAKYREALREYIADFEMGH